MIHIDGSQGEGGGQILRSALALSIATGKPFRITGIRARRAKPGLMRQHLTCVQAAAAICVGKVTGDAVGSTEVTFHPGDPQPGAYRFAVGTAGGTMLVLQAILPPLLRAAGPSTITVEGGTHNTHAPSFEFFERTLAPLLNRTGASVHVRLERHGFYPAGGGRVDVEIHPTPSPRQLELLERGACTGRRASAIVSLLPFDIAQRELAVLRDRLDLTENECHTHQVGSPIGPGNALLVELGHDHVTEVFTALGRVGTPAETVASELADEVLAYTASSAPVGPHLADQLMVPLALLAGGRYLTGQLTEHALTNIATLSHFGAIVKTDTNGVVRIDPLT